LNREPLFFDDRPLHNATEQEAADCLLFISKLRVLRKLGGFGSVEVKMKDGVLKVWLVHQQENIDERP